MIKVKQFSMQIWLVAEQVIYLVSMNKTGASLPCQMVAGDGLQETSGLM
jgi:hypothetical protein